MGEEKYGVTLTYDVDLYRIIYELEAGERVWLTGTRVHPPGDGVVLAWNGYRRDCVVVESRRVVEDGEVWGELLVEVDGG